jgi:cell division protein FtsW (lipid II flippase)/cell division protein FtsI/penicillin-binding protein 2
MGTQAFRPLRRRLSISERTIALLLGVLTTLFMLAGALTLHLTPYPLTLSPQQIAIVVAGWGLAWGGSALFLRARLTRFDLILLPIVALLTGWGLLLQARLAPAPLIKQVLWLILGCAAMCAVAVLPNLTRMLRRYRYSLLTAGLVLLGMTMVFGTNPSGFGQRLWLGAFGIYLQPSEPLKLLLVIYLAAYLADKRDLPTTRAAGKPSWLIVLGPMAAMVGVALLLLGWQQDLGAALLFYLTFVMMVYLAWGNPWFTLLSLLCFLPVGLAGYLLSARVALRISIWLDPWSPAQADRAFQILQSLFAFSSGGLFGQGLGQGLPGLIPAVHTDFVYAALVEEFGLAGGLGLLLLMAAFIYRGVRLAQHTESSFESLLAGGIAALVGVQTWVIVGGNAKLLPLTGVTLPFLSYGGSSLVTVLIATGLLLNLSAPHAIPFNLSLVPGNNRPPKYMAAHLGQGLILLLASTALVTGYWAISRAESLQSYLSNPRYILAESRIRRGRILDRNGVVLADITINPQGYVTRTYPVPEAAPVVGYATFAYGTDGIEAACDVRLRGEIGVTPQMALEHQLLHIDPVGRDVQLTIDARLQEAAQTLLGNHVGAAVLVDARSGEILALASSPIYNAATVAQEWADLLEEPNSPLLNRATQGLAQPGSSLQPFILASALQKDPSLAPATPLTRPISHNDLSLGCRQPPVSSESANPWSIALQAACPYPFVTTAQQAGDEVFADWLRAWGLLTPPSIILPTVAADLTVQALESRAEALGQGNLLVTPLQMALAMATLGNDGVEPALRLLNQPQRGCTPAVAAPAESAPARRVLDADIAEQVLWTLPAFQGSVGHIGTSLAGPQRQQAWYVGLNSATLPRYAVAVFLDEIESSSRGSRAAAHIGSSLLQKVLERQPTP